MTSTPVYGCDGCRGTLGAAGCPTHSRTPTHVHDYQPYPHVAGPQRIYCRTCGHVIDIERSSGRREDAL